MLDKSEGMTSFQAASCLKKIYQQKKTGHTGTLDPMATGVLPVALGKATRFIDFLPDAEKAYTARFRCGMTTDTLDITGKVLSQMDAHVTLQQIQAVLPAFTGDILQVPPMYSALSVNGQRLYQLARRGMEVERQARPVHIDSLTLSQNADGDFTLEVRCSRGTYIRSLIDDIGKALGCGAVMTALRRTASNGFFVEQAHTAQELCSDPVAALIPIDAPFASLRAVTVTQKQAVRFGNGGELAADRVRDLTDAGRYRVYAPSGAFLGLGELRQAEEPALIVLRSTGYV